MNAVIGASERNPGIGRLEGIELQPCLDQFLADGVHVSSWTGMARVGMNV